MPKKILVIDDDPDIVAALTIRLRAAGYEVISSPNGTRGLLAARSEQPDVILLDIGMPDIDGWGVGRRPSAPKLADIPVIILSANVQEHTKQAALAAGAVCFLSKPYDSQTVITAIETAVFADVSQ